MEQAPLLGSLGRAESVACVQHPPWESTSGSKSSPQDCPQQDLVPAQEHFGIDCPTGIASPGQSRWGQRMQREKKKKKKTRHWLGQLVYIKVSRRSPCVALRQFVCVCEDLFRERAKHSPVTGPMAGLSWPSGRRGSWMVRQSGRVVQSLSMNISIKVSARPGPI